MEKHRVRQNEQKRKMMIIAVLSVIVIVSVIAGAITGFKPKGNSTWGLKLQTMRS